MEEVKDAITTTPEFDIEKAIAEAEVRDPRMAAALRKAHARFQAAEAKKAEREKFKDYHMERAEAKRARKNAIRKQYANR